MPLARLPPSLPRLLSLCPRDVAALATSRQPLQQQQVRSANTKPYNLGDPKLWAKGIYDCE